MLSDDGLLADVMRRVPKLDSRMEYRIEVYTVDALFVGGEDLFRDRLGYPSRIYALIEHEIGDNVEEEMWKLIHWRAPLKVLMFYDWADDEKKDDGRRDWVVSKLNKLGGMLSTVNEFHPEESGTEYLFLIGSRATWNGPVTWQFASNKLLQPTPLTRRG